jgi:microcystin degradation protein MlrC
MAKVLIAECMQEISSFNPLESEYEDFHITRGNELLSQRGLNSALGGALSVLERETGIEVVPTISAIAPSAGLLSAKGWAWLRAEMLAAIGAKASGVDAVLFSLHGAMGAAGELDPEGDLLGATRALVGSNVPIVVSLDLHGILTERMLAHIDGFAVYYTYPHVDFGDTGARAARLLMRILKEGLSPLTARVVIPALVRGDELVTKSGCYGEILGEAKLLEQSGVALAAAVMIGNPFTDVPELCTQALVTVTNDGAGAKAAAEGLAREFWQRRHRMQGKLIALEKAIAQAAPMQGTVIFTDAADATSSGASGDSNAILRALMAASYNKRVLAPIVDPGAAAAAAKAGIGATVTVELGGAHDKRFKPIEVTGRVRSLSDGKTRLETMRRPIDSGLTAVIEAANYTIVTLSKPAFLFDRSVFYANGCDPRHFDLVVVKSPHTEPHMFDAWCVRNFNVDAPGSTSADLKSLGHTICRRPMFPLDGDIDFEPKAQLYRRGERRQK